MTRLWWGVGVIAVTWQTTWPPRVNWKYQLLFSDGYVPALNRNLILNRFRVMKAIILNNNSRPYWELTCYFYQENLNHEENINHDVSSWLFVTTNWTFSSYTWVLFLNAMQLLKFCQTLASTAQRPVSNQLT